MEVMDELLMLSYSVSRHLPILAGLASNWLYRGTAPYDYLVNIPPPPLVITATFLSQQNANVFFDKVPH